MTLKRLQIQNQCLKQAQNLLGSRRVFEFLGAVRLVGGEVMESWMIHRSLVSSFELNFPQFFGILKHHRVVLHSPERKLNN